MTIPRKKILCAVDFSAFSDAVVQYAATMHQTAMELTLLYIAPRRSDDDLTLKKHLHEFSRYSEMLAQHNAHALFTVQYGEPAAGILFYAQEHAMDMIVLGSHGTNAITRLLVGSTTETVMRRAFCPVVILKTPTNTLTTAEQKVQNDSLHDNNQK